MLVCHISEKRRNACDPIYVFNLNFCAAKGESFTYLVVDRLEERLETTR